MRRVLWILILICGLLPPAVGQSDSVPSFYQRYRFLLAPPGQFHEGLAGFSNPANLALLHSPELQFHWSGEGRKALTFDDWGFFAGFPHLGFGAQRRHGAGMRVTDYRFGLGFGSRVHASGLAYGWTAGDRAALGGERELTTATIIRPLRHFSLGVTGHFGLETGAQEWVGEVALRPFGRPGLTLFADAAWPKRARLEDVPWSAGVAVQVVPGVDLAGRLFESDVFTVGLRLDFGQSGISSQAHYDTDQNYANQTYAIRLGGMRPSVFPPLLENRKRYVALDLHGRVGYLKYRLFDARTLRLYQLLSDIEAAAEDPRVGAIAVNLSGLRVAPEHAWELREALRGARSSGLRVLAFIDQGGMTDYHLASIADDVIMDPEGLLMLEGYALGRSYLKGTLAKLGLAFEEWRLYKYKSAAETLSRDRMSDADREQYQAFVDDWYTLTRSDVCAARALSFAQFDSLVDHQMLFTATRARASGLVDTLARWSDVGKIVAARVKPGMRRLGAPALFANALPPEAWGPQPEIALVYALGECALDEGIRARWLERLLLRLSRTRSVKAIVFRVDSPGGDAMASDLVAEALRKCSKQKPVIVSQGQVAGSGGYAISMYGDTIVAGPNTFTGSIGVIGGWLYDDGFGDKIGMTADHVQRGAHADYASGVRLPLLGLQIPARDLTAEERAVVDEVLRNYYDIFVQKVAAGRNLPVDEVRRIGEGRFYSGVDAQALGLVDELGGLLTALAIARQRAGLDPSADVKIVEFPRDRGLLDLSRLTSPLRAQVSEDPVLRFIRLAAEARGRPLPLLAPGTYPSLDN